MSKKSQTKVSKIQKIVLPVITPSERVRDKYFTKQWTPRSKNGMSLKYFIFTKHYFKTIEEVHTEILRLGSWNGSYYVILKVMKDGDEVFTFVPADCNSSITRPGDLEGLHIVKFMGSFPELWFGI